MRGKRWGVRLVQLLQEASGRAWFESSTAGEHAGGTTKHQLRTEGPLDAKRGFKRYLQLLLFGFLTSFIIIVIASSPSSSFPPLSLIYPPTSFSTPCPLKLVLSFLVSSGPTSSQP